MSPAEHCALMRQIQAETRRRMLARIDRELAKRTDAIGDLGRAGKDAATRARADRTAHRLTVERVAGRYQYRAVCACGEWYGPVAWARRTAERDADAERDHLFRPLSEHCEHTASASADGAADLPTPTATASSTRAPGVDLERRPAPVMDAVDPSAVRTVSRPVDVAPMPEPDAADVEEYEVAELFGAVGEGADARWPTVAARGREPVVTYRHRRAPVTARDRARRELVREADEREALERAWADLPRSAAVPLRLANAAPARRPVDQVDGATPPRRLHDVAPPPSALAHMVCVGAILATLVASAAGIALLLMSVNSIPVPGLAWPLALSLPALGAGVLTGALPAWQAPTIRVRVSVAIVRPSAW